MVDIHSDIIKLHVLRLLFYVVFLSVPTGLRSVWLVDNTMLCQRAIHIKLCLCYKCIIFTAWLRCMVFMHEMSVKVAAQPDPSLKPRAAHTHCQSSARGGLTREGQQRHKSVDSHRGYPRSTALMDRRGFCRSGPLKRNRHFIRKAAVIQYEAALDGTGLRATNNEFSGCSFRNRLGSSG